MHTCMSDRKQAKANRKNHYAKNNSPLLCRIVLRKTGVFVIIAVIGKLCLDEIQNFIRFRAYFGFGNIHKLTIFVDHVFLEIPADF